MQSLPTECDRHVCVCVTLLVLFKDESFSFCSKLRMKTCIELFIHVIHDRFAVLVLLFWVGGLSVCPVLSVSKGSQERHLLSGLKHFEVSSVSLEVSGIANVQQHEADHFWADTASDFENRAGWTRTCRLAHTSIWVWHFVFVGGYP